MHHYKPNKKKKKNRDLHTERERERASLEKEKWSTITNPVKKKKTEPCIERESVRAWRKKSGNGFERNNG
jgi:hypothetical protein